MRKQGERALRNIDSVDAFLKVMMILNLYTE